MVSGRVSTYDEKKHNGQVKKYINEGGFLTIAGLAVYMGINKDTLYEWVKRYPVFSDSIKEVKEIQEHMIVSGAMEGEYNPTMGIFLLKNNHGYKDRQEVAVSTPETKLDKMMGELEADEQD